jgi:UMF1 family MFS transporter
LLACLAVGNLAYQIAIVFYDSLLPSVASDERSGLVSGLGVGFGYFGTIVTIGMALVVQNRFAADLSISMAAAAGLFLLTSLPCMAFVRERRVVAPAPLTGAVIRERVDALWQTARNLPRDRPLMLFFLGNFFLVDVLNTAIFFFASFTRDIFKGAASREALVFLGHSISNDTFAMIMGLILCSLALVFGLVAGVLSDRTNPLSTLRAAGWCLLVSLLVSAWAGGSMPLLYALAMGFAGAFGLAGIWTAGRKLLIVLAPRADLGMYFGLYGVTNKVSVLGSTTFALVADIAYRRLAQSGDQTEAIVGSQRIALAVQVVPILLGLWFLYRIPREQVPVNAANRSRGGDRPDAATGT